MVSTTGRSATGGSATFFKARALGTWRFMGSYKWSRETISIIITHIRGLITPVIATHEPPSMGPFFSLAVPVKGSCK